MFWEKLGLLKPILNKKNIKIFGLMFPLYKYYFKTHISRMTSLNPFYRYMLLLTKVKQISYVLKIKKK